MDCRIQNDGKPAKWFHLRPGEQTSESSGGARKALASIGLGALRLHVRFVLRALVRAYFRSAKLIFS